MLYDVEGRVNLNTTIRTVAKAANTFDVNTIVVFAISAEAVLKLHSLVDDSREVIAVTFPAGLSATVGNEITLMGMPSEDDRRRLSDAGIPLLQGVMPFRPLGDAEIDQVRTLRRALGFFGGGMQLCVQAVLMAADAGKVRWNQRCIAMSADTAIVANAEHAHRFLGTDSRFMIEHILCKPVNYSISNPRVKKTEAAEEVKPLHVTAVTTEASSAGDEGDGENGANDDKANEK